VQRRHPLATSNIDSNVSGFVRTLTFFREREKTIHAALRVLQLVGTFFMKTVRSSKQNLEKNRQKRLETHEKKV